MHKDCVPALVDKNHDEHQDADRYSHCNADRHNHDYACNQQQPIKGVRWTKEAVLIRKQGRRRSMNRDEAGTSVGFWLGGSMPPCRQRQKKF